MFSDVSVFTVFSNHKRDAGISASKQQVSKSEILSALKVRQLAQQRETVTKRGYHASTQPKKKKHLKLL